MWALGGWAWVCHSLVFVLEPYSLRKPSAKAGVSEESSCHVLTSQKSSWKAPWLPHQTPVWLSTVHYYKCQNTNLMYQKLCFSLDTPRGCFPPSLVGLPRQAQPLQRSVRWWLGSAVYQTSAQKMTHVWAKNDPCLSKKYVQAFAERPAASKE